MKDRYRTKLILIFMWLAFVCLGNSMTSPAYSKECSEMEAYAAESVVDYLNTWEEIHRAYQAFGHCDDGAVAEGFDEAISLMWANRWGELNVMYAAIKADIGFESFISRRIDIETVPSERWELIRSHAKTECPEKMKDFCSRLLTPKRLDIDFYLKDETYSTARLEEDIKKYHGSEVGKAVIVVVTPSTDDPRYKQQNEYLVQFDFEGMEVLLVTASAQKPDNHSYHTSTATTGQLQAKYGEFAVIIADSKGIIAKVSPTPLTGDEVRKAFTVLRPPHK